MRLLILFAFISFSSTNLISQRVFKSYSEAENFIEQSTAGNDGQSPGIELLSYGVVLMDSGTACSGRLLYNLRNVDFSTKIKPLAICGMDEEKKALILTINCSDNNRCIFDPTFMTGSYTSGSKENVFVFFDIKKGLSIVNALTQAQGFVQW